MQLLSLQIGQPVERVSPLRDGKEAAWTSAIVKQPVPARLRLLPEHLDGDGQADLKDHGGPDKAICCYAAEHYGYWRALLGKEEGAFGFGAFGENFTLAGLTEEETCLGDIFSVGTARVQVSQPRVPCFKLGRRWGRPSLPGEVKETGKTGYYLRVLQTGEVGAGDALTRLERPLPQWTVARLNHAFYAGKDDAALAAEIAGLSLLSEDWRGYFRRRLGPENQ